MDMNVMKQPLKIWIVEQTLKENPRFKDVWHRNVSLEDPSRSRQLQRFGIINPAFLPV
jgi:hypothetical protein